MYVDVHKNHSHVTEMISKLLIFVIFFHTDIISIYWIYYIFKDNEYPIETFKDKDKAESCEKT